MLAFVRLLLHAGWAGFPSQLRQGCRTTSGQSTRTEYVLKVGQQLDLGLDVQNIEGKP